MRNSGLSPWAGMVMVCVALIAVSPAYGEGMQPFKGDHEACTVMVPGPMTKKTKELDNVFLDRYTVEDGSTQYCLETGFVTDGGSDDFDKFVKKVEGRYTRTMPLGESSGSGWHGRTMIGYSSEQGGSESIQVAEVDGAPLFYVMTINQGPEDQRTKDYFASLSIDPNTVAGEKAYISGRSLGRSLGYGIGILIILGLIFGFVVVPIAAVVFIVVLLNKKNKSQS